ncbi:MAG: hypothetical protein U9R43_03850 [Thermodesulfobacteriota bacterium]|nr:hypothetical protein [Thermodesulfobacteriota bacterium]
MGFTDFPHANSIDAINAAFTVIENDAEMAVMHFDDGVPWAEALDNVTNGTSYLTTYHENFLNSIAFKKSKIPVGHMLYLAVTPLNFLRNGLADHRGEVGNEALVPPWSTYSLDHTDVIATFTQHCLNMIDAFSPDYFAYAIEANIPYASDPSQWAAFVTLVQNVYTSVKAVHPGLPVFVTLQTSFFHGDVANQTTAINQILPYTDLIAVSAYHFSIQSDPKLLAADHFLALADLAPVKPFAVAETGWPAEDITDVNNNTVVLVPADEEAQDTYIKRLLSDADTLSAEFVTLFFTRDYDDFWESDFKFLPNAQLLRTWKDTGLYDGLGNPRPSLDTWHQYLNRSRQ